MPSKGSGMHLTITNSSNLFKSQGFADHALYVTKRKDTENAASHSCNSYDPRNPIIDFADYFDGENLVQEDLVMWFNLGMHHVPHTGEFVLLFGAGSHKELTMCSLQQVTSPTLCTPPLRVA